MMSFLFPWYRHSPWSGNLYREAPDVFLWRFGFAHRDTPGAKPEIGKACEAAVQAAMLHGLSDEDAVRHAQNQFDEAMKGEVFEERDDIQSIMKQALQAFRALGKPLTYQSILKLEAGERFGLKHAVKVKTDFGFSDFTLDMKVTWRMPSVNKDTGTHEPKFAHVAQLGTYHALSGKPQALLYVTPKKHALIRLRPTELAAGWATMLSTWRRIDALDAMFESPEAAVKLIALNLDSFYWPEEQRHAAATIWGAVAEDIVAQGVAP